jgi:hypothetical protein
MKTVNIKPITSSEGEVNFHFWQDNNEKWWTCRTGEYRGIASESDDLGPFDTEDEALKEQQADYEATSKN